MRLFAFSVRQRGTGNEIYARNCRDFGFFFEFLLVADKLIVLGVIDKLGIFYRALHVVPAPHCHRKSSVRPSLTLRHRGHIGWTSSKLITQGSSLLGATTSAI